MNRKETGINSTIRDADHLNPHARTRLSKALTHEGVDDSGKEQALDAAGTVYEGILPRIDHRLKTIPSATNTNPVLKDNSKYLNIAAHVLSISGYDVDCGPVKDGKRHVTTNHHALLDSVAQVFEDSAERLEEAWKKTVPDEEVRQREAFGRAVSAGMDEIAFTIFDKLRDDRDARRQKEKDKAELVLDPDVPLELTA